MNLLSKYYNKAAILPFGITTVIGIILALTHDGSTYKSEWSTDDGFVLTVFLTILLSAVIAILSLTIFLNKYSAIKDKALLSLLTWTALPGALCVFVIYEEILNFSGSSTIDGVYYGSRLMDGYILTIVCFHLFGVILSYLHFRSVGSMEVLHDNTAANGCIGASRAHE